MFRPAWATKQHTPWILVLKVSSLILTEYPLGFRGREHLHSKLNSGLTAWRQRAIPGLAAD